MRLNLTLILLAVACVSACATRPFTPNTASEARQSDIRKGDVIRVVTTNRERLSFKVEQVQEDRLIGVAVEPNIKETLPPGTAVVVPYADIAMIEVCIASIGCVYRPTQHPMAEPVQPEDATYDCSQLDATTLKADTVRWVIRDDGGRLEGSGQKAARYAGNVLLIPLALYVGNPGYMFNDGGHAVLNAADRRILELLRLKRGRGCPAAATSEPGMTDLEMLEALEPLMPDTGNSGQAALDKRTLLLDHLRAPLPAQPLPAAPKP